MNYKRIYNNLIQNRVDNPLIEGYLEKHHILPKSLGGTNDKDNLVNLSAREHFVCHYLLAKMYKKESNEWYKMNHAFMMMKCSSTYQNRYFNSRLYEALRGNFSTVMSLTQSGKGNSQFGTMWIYNLELKESKKVPKGDVPDGWLKGRKMKFVDVKKDVFCKECGTLILPIGKELFCSDKCKQYNRSPYIKDIDLNIESLIEAFNKNMSIDKTLKEFGIVGERVGNTYFSKILKSKGISILKRRNTLL